MSLYDQIQAEKAGGSLYDSIQKEKQQKEDKGSSWASYAKEPLISLLNLGSSIGELTRPGFIPKGQKIDWRKAVGGTPEEDRNWGHAAAGFAPELGAAVLAPEVAVPSALSKGAAAIKGGKAMLKALQQAGTQAGVAAAFNPDDALESAKTAGGLTVPFSLASHLVSSGNPVIRSLAKFATGAGAGLVTHELAKTATGSEAIASPAGLAAGFLSNRPSMSSFARKLNSSRLNPELESKLMQAGENLGIDVGIHEANPHYQMGKIYGGVGKTAPGAEAAFGIAEKKAAQQEGSIFRLFDTIYSKDLQPKMEELYKTASATPASKADMKGLMKNDIIREAIKNVANKSVYQQEFKNLKSPNSVGFWDLVKRSMDDMVSKETNIQGSLTNEGRLIQNARKKLVSKLDKLAPEYKDARALAQRKITRDNLENVFNKKEFNAANLAKHFDNKKEFNKLLNGLKNVPEAQNQVKDMKLLFRHLLGNPKNAKAGAALESISVNKPRSDFQYMFEKINEKIGGKFDKAAIELMSNPKWREELNKLSQVTNKEKLTGKFIDLAGKAVAQEAAQSQ